MFTIQRQRGRVIIIGNPGLEVRMPGGGAADYRTKVLSYSPIAYWMLAETSGTVATCEVNVAQNGTYSSDVSGWPPGTGIGDGSTAPFFDGTNDYVNIFTATFSAAFNGATGSAVLWLKVANAGVWTDGIAGYPLSLYSDATNLYRFQKAAANNTFIWFGRAGGGTANITDAAAAGVAWENIAITWSDGANADQFKAYRNGTQFGATSAALNVWAGVGLSDTATVIGSGSTAPAVPFHGWLAHCAIFGSALAPADIADLATV